MTIKTRFPSIEPSLDLNFAKLKRLDPRVTFTRASSGTYVGSNRLIKTADINEPRFDHNPTTGESLGLLVEESRTNLGIYSDVSQSSYIENITVLANNDISPDGTNNATRLTSTTTGTSNSNIADRAVTVSSNTVYTFSCYLKQGNTPLSSINLWYGGGTYREVRIAYTWSSKTIALTGTAGTGFSGSAIDAGNGWVRLVVSLDSGNNTTAHARIHVRDNTTSGVTGDFVYAWGRQIEAGAFPTSYIPTTASSATRSADVASITGNNFSSWYRQDEGTVFADLVTSSRGHNAYPRLVAILGSDVNTGNEASIYTRNISSAEDYRLFGAYWDAIGSSADFNPGSGAPLGSGRVAMAIKNNDGGYCVNGAAPLSDTSCAVPTPVQLRLFGAARFQPASSGYIRRLTYWPQRLSNAVLQVLTS